MKQKKNKALLKLASNVVENRGGARVGAGRKPLEIPTKKVTFSVRYDLVKQLKEFVKEWKNLH